MLTNNLNSRNFIFPLLNNNNILIDEIFKSFNDNFFSKQKILPNYPPMDIYQKGDNFFIDIIVAGFNKDEISISTKNKILTIKTDKNNNKNINNDCDCETKCENESKEQNNNKHYILNNISKKTFERSFEFLKNIENVEANIENGILSIKVLFENNVENEKIIEIK